MKKLVMAAMAAAASILPMQALTVEDYCDVKLSKPAGIKEMRPMADGESYAAISDDGKSIEVYSYKTGEKIRTLFNVDEIKGDVKITEFDGYKLSSNEKKILLWNDPTQIWRYSFRAEYYVYDIMRGTMKRVSEKGPQRAATLSHDGLKVAYERDNNIFIANLDYGTDNAITTDGKINEVINGTPDWGYEEEFGVLNTMRWSSDDNVLAYVRFDESKVPVYNFDNYKSYCEENPLDDPYPSQYSYKYTLAGGQNSIVSVNAYDLNTRATKTMDLPLEETDYIPAMEFGGNGVDCLMVVTLNRNQNDLKLYRVNPASTVAKLVYSEKNNAWLAPETYRMAKYGKTSFVMPSDKSGYRHLYEYDYNGNLLRQITKGDFNVTAYYGTDAKGIAYVQTTAKGAINRNVASVDRAGLITLLHNEEGTESASFSRNYKYYVRTYNSATVPPQYTLWTAAGKKIKDLELNTQYAAKYAALPQKEFVKLKNAAGQEMDGFVIKPIGFDPNKKYPLLIYQYNGPDSQLVLNSWKVDGTYYFAEEGYVVGCMDGRGTGNRDRQWAHCVYRNIGQYETADQIAGAKELGNYPYVDSDRMACFGWSYGGYMTLMELTDAGNPFKCGVAMAPVTDWRWYDSIYTERYMSTPQQNENGYNLASAMDRTKNLKARLLIMHGTSDDNVHFYNTLKYASKLNYEGTIFDMMALTGFEHSLRMCNARTMLYRKIVDFLDTQLK